MQWARLIAALVLLCWVVIELLNEYSSEEHFWPCNVMKELCTLRLWDTSLARLGNLALKF